MWAIRRASVRIKSQPLPSVASRACNSKTEMASSTYMDHSGFGGPTPTLSDESLLLRKFSTQARGPQSSFIGIHGFSSQAGSESETEKERITEADISGSEFESESEKEPITDSDMSESKSEVENELDSLDTEEEITRDNVGDTRGSLELFKVVVKTSSTSAKNILDKWIEEGHVLSRVQIARAMFELRKRRMYTKALQLSEWLDTQENVELSERDYSSRADLIAKVVGMQKAEAYIKKIPESFKGEIVYRTLLANYVVRNEPKKAETLFNKMKDLKLPITVFACNQLLLLYKRLDKKKIADVLLLMEKENLKPTLFTYRMLIETKGMSNDITGMEQVLETMKAEGFEPDLRLQDVFVRHYIHAGMMEKAKEVVKEMEGSNLSENRRACRYLLHIYALLGSEDDVKRVWDACEKNPQLEESIRAIEAFGKLKKVEEAEVVFNQLLAKWKKLTAKQYTAMLKVYADNKMLEKGKEVVKQMSESGCRLGAWTWDALVKLYIETGEIEKADSILNKASQQFTMKPLFDTYMLILDHYAKKGDVHNAEKIFYRMRHNGYVSRFRQYDSLLQAYINAKVPGYGFAERLKADNVFPGKLLAERLSRVDAFKKTAVSDFLD